MTNNPLMNFARKAELSVRLPSKGNWYPEDMIEYTPNGEVEVYPMLPKDEMCMLNPDALVSGQANINMIKSCVPGIKNPEKLLFPDANVLFLAIYKATYGDTYEIKTICPNCYKESENKEVTDDDIHTEKFSINELLNQITYLDKEYIVTTDEGLKIYLTPNTVYDKNKYSYLTFQYEKARAVLNNAKESGKTSEEIYNDKEFEKEIFEIYEKISQLNIEIIAGSIIKVVLPDETTVTDKNMITEYVGNISSQLIGTLSSKIFDINNIGLPTHLSIKCEKCGHTWEEVFYGYNQSDFFGLSY